MPGMLNWPREAGPHPAGAQLVDLVDVPRLDAMKGLQQQWKQTGALPRTRTKLWEEFRANATRSTGAASKPSGP